MDDADGGLRGVRAQPCPGLRRALEDHWGLGWFTEVVDLGGSSSLNLLVGDAGRGYVVRVHRPHVTPDRLGAIHQARRALLAGGVPCAPPVPTRQGRPWVRFEGRLVEVEVYVDYDAVMDSWQRLEAGMDAALDIPLSETERAALPVAMARQPLSSIGGWVARLDDPAAARRHLASVGPELAAALELMTELDRWQDAFAWPERRGRSGHLTSAAARPGSAGGARRPAASG